MNKCTFQKGGYAKTLCKPMSDSASAGSYGKSKGLFAANIVNLESGERLGIGIIVKSERIPKGLYLNFCPFCGGELRDMSDDCNEANE